MSFIPLVQSVFVIDQIKFTKGSCRVPGPNVDGYLISDSAIDIGVNVS